MLFNLVALVLSTLALASSTYLALQAGGLQRRANFLPVYIEMLNEFRSLEFNDHYRTVTHDLPRDHDPQLGISGLPADVRKAVYDVAYYFQNFVALRLLDIIDDQIIAAMHIRIVAAWDAIAPFVRRERELNATTTGPYLLLVLEGFATSGTPDLSIRPFSRLLRPSHRELHRRRLEALRQAGQHVGPGLPRQASDID